MPRKSARKSKKSRSRRTRRSRRNRLRFRGGGGEDRVMGQAPASPQGL